MTRLFKFHSVFLLLLILIMAASANAQPEAFNPTGPMDWELYTDDIATLYANTEFARMATSPMTMDPMDNLLPPQYHPHSGASTVPSRTSRIRQSYDMIMNNGMVLQQQQQQRRRQQQQQTDLSLDITTGYVLASTVLRPHVATSQPIDLPDYGNSEQQWAAPPDDNRSAPALNGTGGQFHSSPLTSRALDNVHRNSLDQLHATSPAPSHWSNTPDLRHDTPLMEQFSFPQYSQGALSSTSDSSNLFPHAGLGLPFSVPTPHTARSSIDGFVSADTLSSGTHHAVDAMHGSTLRAPAISDCSSLQLDTSRLVPSTLPTPGSVSPVSAHSTGSLNLSSRHHQWPETVPETVDEYPFVCNICQMGFDAQGELTHHTRCHQPYPERRHVCDHCFKRFQYRKDLTRHLPQHNPNRPRYRCPHVGCKYNANKGFGRPDHLERHRRTQHRSAAAESSRRRRSH